MAQKEYTLGATAAGNDIICEDRERGLKVERMLYLFVQSTISGVQVSNHICPG